MCNEIPNIRIDGKVAYIKLPCGSEAIIDAEDTSKVAYRGWSKTHNYVQCREMQRDGSLKSVSLHRVIYGVPVKRHIDHKNGNVLDNRKTNLREATPGENAMNQKRAKNNTSGFKGVSWNKRYEKWASYISLGNKRKHLGYFRTKEEAAAAYAEASKRYHGEFGRVE